MQNMVDRVVMSKHHEWKWMKFPVSITSPVRICQCIQSLTDCKKLERHVNLPRHPAHQEIPRPASGARRFGNCSWIADTSNFAAAKHQPSVILFANTNDLKPKYKPQVVVMMGFVFTCSFLHQKHGAPVCPHHLLTTESLISSNPAENLKSAFLVEESRHCLPGNWAIWASS